MSTAIVLGNGKILININEKLNIADLFWPYVGQDNHLSSLSNELFFLINGKYHFLSDKDWEISTDYLTESLCSISLATNNAIGIQLIIKDCVLVQSDIFLRILTIKNLSNAGKKLLIFFKNNFCISGNDIGDTALWYPKSRILCHYKKDVYIGVGSNQNIFQFNCSGPLDNDGKGSSPDNSGNLVFNPISTGSVQSCYSQKVELNPLSECTIDSFFCLGNNFESIDKQVNFIRRNNTYDLYKTVDVYWSNWLNNTIGIKKISIINKKLNDINLSENIFRLYQRSLLIIRTHIDNGGAVIASTDTKYLKSGGKDSYSYFWPRDGAMTIISLIESGYKEIAEKFFRLCSRIIQRDGLFYHKYFPEFKSGRASSWHAWIDEEGQEQLPIQEDETALVVYALGKYFDKYRDLNFIREMWNGLVIPSLNFIIQYRYFNNGNLKPSAFDKNFTNSKLVKPSYNIWETKRGIFPFTVAAVYSALKEASKLAKYLKYLEVEKCYLEVADQLKHSFEVYFFADNKIKNGVYFEKYQKKIIVDSSIDSSSNALWYFDMYDINDNRIDRIVSSIESALWVKTNIGGIARFENDNYLKTSNEIVGNPWFITTSWLAQYWIRKKNYEKAKLYINWIIKHTDEIGLMAEQADPYTGFGKSVKPLIWSHAEYVRMVNLLID